MDSVAAERVELERALEEVNSALRDVWERLCDVDFLDKAKPALLQEQHRLRDQLLERRQRIEANLATLDRRRPGGLPSSQTGTWSPLPLYPSAPASSPADDDQDDEEPHSAPHAPAEPGATPGAFSALAAEVAEILLSPAGEKKKLKRLRRCVDEVGNDVASLRLIAAALTGFGRDGLRNHVRLLIARLTGTAQPDELPELTVETVPLGPPHSAEALPDPRDGLTRMERIVLSAMWALFFRAAEPPKKTARLVEELRIADASVTAQLVDATLERLSHPWSRQNPLVEVAGAWSRLTPLGDELFCELEDAGDLEAHFNFKVPRILPVRVPLLLAKGTDGVPPHHLGELIGLAINSLEFGTSYQPALSPVFSGPDFPWGGVLPYLPYHLYETGKGAVLVQSKLHWERDPRSPRARLIITELPEPVRVSDVISRLARLPGVVSARSEPQAGQERVVVELEHVAHARGLQALLSEGAVTGRSFAAELRVNDGGHVMVADLQFVLERFLSQRRDVVSRRLASQLRRLQDRAHVIEGLLVATDVLEPLLQVLRDASDPAEELWALKHLASPQLSSEPAFARHAPLSPETLRGKAMAWIARVRTAEPRSPNASHSYDPGFSEAQARAFLKTRRPAALDRDVLLREWSALASEAADLVEKVANRSAIDAIVRAQLVELRARHWRPRRTMAAGRGH